MGERSDRAPLLDWEEVPAAERPEPGAPDRLSSPSNSRASAGPGGPDGCGAPPVISEETPDAGIGEHQSDPGAAVEPLEDRMVRWEEKDQIVSVFVVTFNTRSGGTKTDGGRHVCFCLNRPEIIDELW